MEWVFVKMVLSLAAVLGLMGVLVFALKRFVLPARPGGLARVHIDLLGQRALAPRRSIVVVKVLNSVLVIGMSEHGMQLLDKEPESTLSVAHNDEDHRDGNEGTKRVQPRRNAGSGRDGR